MTFWSLRAELVLNLRLKNRKITQVISKLLLRARLKNWKVGRLQRISTFRRISEVRKRDRH